MSDQPPTREEWDALSRRVRDLEERADAHAVVVAAAIQRQTDRIDMLTGRIDVLTTSATENTTLLRAVARHLGMPDD